MSSYRACSNEHQHSLMSSSKLCTRQESVRMAQETFKTGCTDNCPGQLCKRLADQEHHVLSDCFHLVTPWIHQALAQLAWVRLSVKPKTFSGSLHSSHVFLPNRCQNPACQAGSTASCIDCSLGPIAASCSQQSVQPLACILRVCWPKGFGVTTAVLIY